MQRKNTKKTATKDHHPIAGFPNVQAEYVSVRQAELMSSISEWTWRQYAYKGRIASIKMGTRLLIPVAEIRRVLAEGYRPGVRENAQV